MSGFKSGHCLYFSYRADRYGHLVVFFINPIDQKQEEALVDCMLYDSV